MSSPETPADIMADTLRLIASVGCATLVAPHECRFDVDRTRISETGTRYQWCDPCRATDALERAAEVPPIEVPSQRWRRSVYSPKDRGTWHRLDAAERARCGQQMTRWPIEDTVTVGDQVPAPRGEHDQRGLCPLCMADPAAPELSKL